MGANISMDVSAGLASAEIDSIPATATATDTATTQSSAFEDKLRQEVVLVPEDLADIHIQATAPATDGLTGSTSVVGGRTSPANRALYGKGKHWKKNLKKKATADATDGMAPAPTPVERTIEQRREQVRPIIDRLTELQMNVSYPAIRELYKQLSHFIKTGEDAKIKIPFPEFSRRIKGELSNATYIPCWVKLEME